MAVIASAQKLPTARAASQRFPSRRVYARKTEIVLEAAERAFLEGGYGATSMDAIAERAGVSKRTVYSNFGSKKDLFAAVIRKHGSMVLPLSIEEIDLESSDLEPILTDLATNFLMSICTPEQVELYQTVLAESRKFPELGKLMIDGPFLRSERLFDQFLRAQVDRGRLSFPDIDLAAPQLVAMLKTNVHMRLLFNQPVQVTNASLAASAAASVRLFLSGARPRDG